MSLTSQIVIYETTNVVEVYVEDRPSGCSWNSGYAVLGIQNQTGTQGYTPPGRNTGDWSASNEAWRFTPNGASNVVFSWLDGDGNVIGNDPTINVCPTELVTTYTAQAVYTNCNGEEIIDTDEITITKVADFTVDLGEDIETCDRDNYTLDADPGVTGVTYQWFRNGLAIPGATSSTYTVIAPNSGTYAVEVADGVCVVRDEIEITYLPQPIIASPPRDLYICDDGTTPGIFDLTQNDPLVRGGQDPAFNITYHNTQAAAEAGTPFINPANAYPIVGSSEIIWVRIENATGTCYAIDSFEIVFSTATATAPPSPYYICDQDENGEEPINLNAVFSSVILGSQSPLEFLVTYYDNPGDATAGTNQLPQPYLLTASPTTIYARVENRSNRDCFETTQFEIIMDTPPVINPDPAPLVVCDPDNDGFAPFDLHLADGDITLGDGSLTVTYHPTLSDARNDLNELGDPYVNDDPYNDVVFARIESPNTSCYATAVVSLEVRNTPVLVEPTPLRLCDDDADGLQVFDLTEKAGEILGAMDPLEHDLYYYELEADALAAGDLALTAPDFSAAIPDPTAYGNTVPGGQTIWVLGVGNAANTSPHNGGRGCYDIVPLELVVDPLPVAVQPLPYELCDDLASGSATDQVSTFDLTTRNGEVTGGDPSLTVTWYETPADELADNPIGDPRAYQNRAIPPAPRNPQTIVARVANGFGCKVTVTLTLVVNPLPVPAEPTPLAVCDDNNDGFAQFDLTEKDAEITNGEVGVSVRYYTTRARAEAGSPLNQITGPYTNNVPYADLVYARVEKDATGCYAIVALELVVHPLPDAPVGGFGDLLSCDPDGGGGAVFDLTLNAPYVYGGQSPDFVLTYHTSLADAQAGTPFIGDPSAFPSTGQTIWVRLEDDATGCGRISSFELVVGELPAIADPADMELCDDLASGSDTDGVSVFDLRSNDAAITLGDPSLWVEYYETLEDLENGDAIADPGSYSNPVDGGGRGISPYTLYVGVGNAAGCTATTTLTLVVLPVPRAVAPEPLVACDEDNDGFAWFDLGEKDAEIAGGDPSITVTYHETLWDARNGTLALASPFQNIVRGGQTLYARAVFGQAPNDSGCFTVVELELRVVPSPVVPTELPDLVECDPDGDGRAVFDLTAHEELIYGGQDPALYALTYHLTQADADAGTGAIAFPGAYTNVANPQEIYYRLAAIGGEGCHATGHFALVVSGALAINDPLPFEQCDDLGEPNDMRTVFNLRSKNPEITGGAPGAGVSYFLTEDDARANTNRIDPDTDFVNTENPQRLYVRVADGNTGCAQYTTLLLRVLPNPEPAVPDPLVLCDRTEVVGPGPDDGVEIFDLTSRAAQVLHGASWELSYYEGYGPAVAGDPLEAIADPANYANTSSPQTVYVRATNGDTGCFEIVGLELVVEPLPDDGAAVPDYILCEVGTDGVAVFDLTSKVPEILGGQSPLEHTVSFYLDPVDAANGTNPIPDPGSHENRDFSGNVQNPQTIYTGIGNIGTECYVGGSQHFDLIVQEGAVAVAPAGPFVICDNLGPNDGIGEFDLEDFSSQAVVDLRSGILAGQDPGTYSLEFYETLEGAMSGTGAIVWPYANTINPQVIYARVTNQANLYEPKCFEVAQVVLKVEELPAIDLSGPYRLCVDANGNPIAEEEGGSSPPVLETGLDPSLYSFEWLLEGVLLPGEDGPSLIALQGGAYTVHVTETATGCDATAEATVTVSSPPLVYGAQDVSLAFSGSHTVEVSAEGLGDYVFQLDGGPFQEGNLFEGVAAGAHTVTIRDANGCGSVTIEIGIVDYPPYFTPNGDGYHDTWNIIGIGTADPGAKIYIFDRFGKLLKQLSPTDRGWDGTYGGNPLPSSDYWFRVDYTENGTAKQFRGHFTLKR